MCPNRKGTGAKVKGPQSLRWFLHSLTTGNEPPLFLDGTRCPILSNCERELNETILHRDAYICYENVIYNKNNLG